MTDLTLQRHFRVLTKFAHVESRLSGRKQQEEVVFYTPVNQQNPQSARRNHFPGEQISRWLLRLSKKLSASNYPGAANLCDRREGSASVAVGLTPRSRSQVELCDFCVRSMIVSRLGMKHGQKCPSKDSVEPEGPPAHGVALTTPAVAWRCPWCHGTRRWRSIYDVLICATCHPLGDAALVGAWEGKE
jgi:hypothetical protein